MGRGFQSSTSSHVTELLAAGGSKCRVCRQKLSGRGGGARGEGEGRRRGRHPSPCVTRVCSAAASAVSVVFLEQGGTRGWVVVLGRSAHFLPVHRTLMISSSCHSSSRLSQHSSAGHCCETRIPPPLACTRFFGSSSSFKAFTSRSISPGKVLCRCPAYLLLIHSTQTTPITVKLERTFSPNQRKKNVSRSPMQL